MSSIVPVLARAAGFGALMGLGCECVNEFKGRGRYLTVGVVAAVALQAIAYFFSPGAAVGASLGVLLTSLRGARCLSSLDVKYPVAIGATLLGGTTGHLVGPFFRGVSWLVVV